jgi:2-iminobutanoate/2-iminopropanoate deaminase
VQRLLLEPVLLRGVNVVYAEYFAAYKPARIFICTAGWFGPFDMEIDCVALAK